MTMRDVARGVKCTFTLGKDELSTNSQDSREGKRRGGFDSESCFDSCLVVITSMILDRQEFSKGARTTQTPTSTKPPTQFLPSRFLS